MTASTPAPLSAGAKFRAALAAEKPLQVVGAINAYAARMAEATGFRALYLSGGGVAANSLGLPDLGISTMDDVLIDIRRITEASTLAAAGGRGHRLGRRLQHRAHRALLHQGRRRRPAHRRPGAGQALRPSPRQGSGAARGDGGSRQGGGGCAHRCQLRHHGAQRCAGQRGPRRDDRAAGGLRGTRARTRCFPRPSPIWRCIARCATR